MEEWSGAERRGEAVKKVNGHSIVYNWLEMGKEMVQQEVGE